MYKTAEFCHRHMFYEEREDRQKSGWEEIVIAARPSDDLALVLGRFFLHLGVVVLGGHRVCIIVEIGLY